MIRSLSTGVSALQSNQTRMDVIGNNIANVNTLAFKRGRAAFNEVLGQKLFGVGRTSGGTEINPSNVGLGVAVGSVTQDWEQGALQSTGINTDLALNGDGFFIVNNGKENWLTRAGNFTTNYKGELVSTNGFNVQGWAFDQQTGQLITGELKDLKIDPNAKEPAKFTENVQVGGNLSADTADGESTSVSTVVYDEQGRAHDVVVTFTKVGDPDTSNNWSYEIDGGNAFAGVTTGTIDFNTDGTIQTVSPPSTLTWDSNFVTGGPTLNFDLQNISQFSGSSTATVRDQDGHPAGELAGFTVKTDGVLELNFTNGEQRQVYQLAIANVNNPNGLEQQGDNLYTTSSASGDMQLGRAGRDVRTAVVAGTLELSNVDLANQFSDMIVTQRGYQAAARVITTSDELLQETVQLKR